MLPSSCSGSRPERTKTQAADGSPVQLPPALAERSNPEEAPQTTQKTTSACGATSAYARRGANQSHL